MMRNPSHWMEYCCWKNCVYNVVNALLAIVDHILVVISLGNFDLYLRINLPFFCKCDYEKLEKHIDEVQEELDALMLTGVFDMDAPNYIKPNTSIIKMYKHNVDCLAPFFGDEYCGCN